MDGVIFSRGDLSWEGGCTLPQKVINLSRASEKIPCGLRLARSFGTDRQIDRDPSFSHN